MVQVSDMVTKLIIALVLLFVIGMILPEFKFLEASTITLLIAVIISVVAAIALISGDFKISQKDPGSIISFIFIIAVIVGLIYFLPKYFPDMFTGSIWAPTFERIKNEGIINPAINDLMSIFGG